jgi:hypothetical protein
MSAASVSDGSPRVTLVLMASWRSAALAVLILASGCVPHPVGPARTDDAFERKAGSTLAGALSTTRTAALAAGAYLDGRAFEPYTCSVLSEAEDSLGGVRGTFASIQPPSGRADGRRTEVLDAVTRSFVDVGRARIACRRSDHADLRAVVPALVGDADVLERLGGGAG